MGVKGGVYFDVRFTEPGTNERAELQKLHQKFFATCHCRGFGANVQSKRCWPDDQPLLRNAWRQRVGAPGAAFNVYYKFNLEDIYGLVSLFIRRCISWDMGLLAASLGDLQPAFKQGAPCLSRNAQV